MWKKLVLVHLLIVLFGNAKVNLFLSKRSYVFLWNPSLNTKEIFFLNALSPWRTKLNCPIQATKWNKHASYIPVLASLCCSTAELETDTEHCCLLPITPFVILSAYHSCCPNNWCGSAPGSLTVGCLSVWRGSVYGRGKAGRKSFNDWRWPFSFQWLIFVWGLALTKWACLNQVGCVSKQSWKRWLVFCNYVFKSRFRSINIWSGVQHFHSKWWLCTPV